MKILFAVILLLSLLANAGAVWWITRLYVEGNASRLDPLQLAVYPDAPAKVPGKQRVVFFGDSRALSWPDPALEGFEFVNRGIGQQTSAQISLRFDQHVQPLHAEVLILQLCVNDLKTIPLFPERRDAIVMQCKQNLQAIIAKARAAGSRVLLTTVFPLGNVPLERSPFWSGEVAVAIREVNQFITAQQADGVDVLDTFSLLQGEPDLIRPEYSRDLLHLNATAYQVLNKALVGVLSGR